MNLTASDRKSLIRLASKLPVGHPKRQTILADLKKSAKTPKDTSDLKNFLNTKYESFVSLLGKSANDPKILALIKSGLADGDKGDDKISFSSTNIAAPKLKPTQNEIDIDKSLAWPLKSKETLEKCMAGSGVEFFGPIVTYSGKYIIDGHHRWSQIYCVNPKATCASVNMTISGLKPLEALKAVQMAIAVKIKKIPVQTVSGTNLLKAGENVVKDYVKKNLKEDLIPIYAKHGAGSDREEIAEYIWKNVQQMQKTSQPVAGAPARGFMPQTDQASGWEKDLADGKINIKPPYEKKSTMNLTASERKSLIRLASKLPVGDSERKAILSGLVRRSSKDQRQRLLKTLRGNLTT